MLEFAHLVRHDDSGLQDPCQPKVSNFCNIAAAIQEHISRFAVKPDNAPFMEICQATSNTQRNKTSLLIPAGLPGHTLVLPYPLAQIAALHELCDEKYLQSKHISGPGLGRRC